jgi:hypothetical protein
MAKGRASSPAIGSQRGVSESSGAPEKNGAIVESVAGEGAMEKECPWSYIIFSCPEFWLSFFFSFFSPENFLRISKRYSVVFVN